MITAILLAAGQSKRLRGENKLTKLFKGKPLINHILFSLIKSKVNKIIIVLGFEHLKIKTKLLKSKKINFVINKNYKKGMSSSIKTGLKKLSKNSQGFLIVLGDMPNITQTTINKICLSITGSDKEIILPKFKNKTGNPIGFKQSMIKNIYKIKGDRGAKDMIKKNNKKIKFLNINSKSILVNLNTKRNFSSQT
jgi:molybdenum cofactor cytidylyltransferase